MAKIKDYKKKETTKKSSKNKIKPTKGTSLENKPNNDKINILKKEISGIFIIACAVFLIVIINKESQIGLIGRTINIFMLSSFGRGAFLLPYAILLIGIMRLLNMIIFDDKNQITAISGFFIAFIMYSSLTNIKVYEFLISEVNLIKLINTSLQFGRDSIGGGVLGNVLTYIGVKLVGKNGTVILISAMIIICTILITNQSIISFTNIILDFLKKILHIIYNFIFIETTNDSGKDKDKTAMNSSRKNKQYNKSQDENIKIFDYTNQQSDKKQHLESNIMNLKIDEKTNLDNNKAVQNLANEHVELDAKKIDDTVFESKEDKEDKASQPENKKIRIKNSEFEKQKISEDIINITENLNENEIVKYIIPQSDLLDPSPNQIKGEKSDLKKEAEKLIETLNSFNIQCNIVQINKGPTITRYELQPAPGIKVSRITSLTNDLAMSLATSEIRIEAPIPNKSAIGIEVPNKIKTSVYLRNLIDSKEYKSIDTKIPFALGKDIAGKNIIAAIDKMPHLLIAGATGSGKSVCINSLIMSILYRAKPDEVKLILIDPKVVELSIYNGIPHLLIPVVTDPRKASNALNWAVSEMTNRYKVFAQNSVRDIYSYNVKMVNEKLGDKMPQIVIVIDELADLMAVASSEVEECITRIAQLARACGIHLVIATQRPSVDVITGVIKANIPSRIAFAVSSYIDSRTILDSSGAEKLLGKGDMLYHPMGLSKPIRIQGTFISDDEIKRVVDNITKQKIDIKTHKSKEIIEEIEKVPSQEEKVDELLEQVIETVVNDGQASASYIQRKFKVGYSRAARMIDQLEERGIVGGHEGSKPRKVLVTVEELEEMRGNS